MRTLITLERTRGKESWIGELKNLGHRKWRAPLTRFSFEQVEDSAASGEQSNNRGEVVKHDRRTSTAQTLPFSCRTSSTLSSPTFTSGDGGRYAGMTAFRHGFTDHQWMVIHRPCASELGQDVCFLSLAHVCSPFSCSMRVRRASTSLPSCLPRDGSRLRPHMRRASPRRSASSPG